MSFLRVLKNSPLLRTYATKVAPVTPQAAAVSPVSSCPADTVLTGLNWLKGQPAVLAMPDEEYPPWLWTVMQPKVIPYDGPGGKTERLNRRRKHKGELKERNFMLTQ